MWDARGREQVAEGKRRMVRVDRRQNIETTTRRIAPSDKLRLGKVDVIKGKRERERERERLKSR
jgi:hypothetical protein